MADISPKQLPLRYRMMRRGFQALSYAVPPLANNIAWDMFCTPAKREVRSGKTKRILEQATTAFVPYTDPTLPDFADLQLHVRTWGDPAHKTVLLAHGWEGQAGSFRDFVKPLLTADFYVVAFDAPGHGESTGDRANLLVFMNSLRAVAAAYGPVYAVVGHSLGGIATLLTAGEDPAVLSQKLVAIAAPKHVTTAFEAFVRFWGLPPSVLQGMYSRVERVVKRTVASFNTAALVTTVTQPVLLVHDRADAEVGFHEAEATQQALPNARLLPTTDLGHQLILRDRDVVQEIVAFLAE